MLKLFTFHFFTFPLLNFGEGLLDIVENVLHVLNANTQTDQVWSHASLAQLFVAELTMGVPRVPMWEEVLVRSSDLLLAVLLVVGVVAMYLLVFSW